MHTVVFSLACIYTHNVVHSSRKHRRLTPSLYIRYFLPVHQIRFIHNYNMKWSLITQFAVLAPVSSTYVWPSSQDSMDDLLFLQSGSIRNGALSDRKSSPFAPVIRYNQANVSIEVKTCDFGAGQPGIQKAAEWLRTAFHDSATHDAAAKTGGLDGSIQFKLDRQENLGAALNNTLADISSSVNKYTSAADALALSMVMAVARCGNFFIPFRTGRVDATEAGPKGVPEATTDLNTTRKRFETASFNQGMYLLLLQSQGIMLTQTLYS